MTSALRRGWGSAPRPGRFTPGKDPVPIVQEAGRAPRPVWTGAENLAHTGIRSQDRPARSEDMDRRKENINPTLVENQTPSIQAVKSDIMDWIVKLLLLFLYSVTKFF